FGGLGALSVSMPRPRSGLGSLRQASTRSNFAPAPHLRRRSYTPLSDTIVPVSSLNGLESREQKKQSSCPANWTPWPAKPSSTVSSRLHLSRSAFISRSMFVLVGRRLASAAPALSHNSTTS